MEITTQKQTEIVSIKKALFAVNKDYNKVDNQAANVLQLVVSLLHGVARTDYRSYYDLLITSNSTPYQIKLVNESFTYKRNKLMLEIALIDFETIKKINKFLNSFKKKEKSEHCINLNKIDRNNTSKKEYNDNINRYISANKTDSKRSNVDKLQKIETELKSLSKSEQKKILEYLQNLIK